jgi:fructose-1-phosphate kinase PfkB-like protein
LPPAIDSYAIIARDAAARGQCFVLDPSGPPLKAALGSVMALIKPSLGEVEALVGCPLADAATQNATALAMVLSGAAARIAAGTAVVSATGTAHPKRALAASLLAEARSIVEPAIP